MQQEYSLVFNDKYFSFDKHILKILKLNKGFKFYSSKYIVSQDPNPNAQTITKWIKHDKNTQNRINSHNNLLDSQKLLTLMLFNPVLRTKWASYGLNIPFVILNSDQELKGVDMTVYKPILRLDVPCTKQNLYRVIRLKNFFEFVFSKYWQDTPSHIKQTYYYNLQQLFK